MMRMASKSRMGLVSSNGLERNKATLLGEPFGHRRRCFPGRLPRVLCPTLGSGYEHSGQNPQFRSPDPTLAAKNARQGWGTQLLIGDGYFDQLRCGQLLQISAL